MSEAHPLTKLSELTASLPPLLAVEETAERGAQEYRVDGGVVFRFNLYKHRPVSVDRWYISAGVDYQMHTHEGQVEMIFVYEGEMVVTIGDNKTTVAPGDSILIPCGVEHAAFFPKATRAITITFPEGEYVAKVV